MGGTTLYLKRAFTGPFGTWGLFSFDNKCPICASLELPWEGNRTNESCIAPGIYDIEIILHPERGRCIRLEDKNGRAGVLIHPGNTILDSSGCILPGMGWGKYMNHRAVVKSREAMGLLLDMVDSQKLTNLKVIGIGEK